MRQTLHLNHQDLENLRTTGLYITVGGETVSLIFDGPVRRNGQRLVAAANGGHALVQHDAPTPKRKSSPAQLRNLEKARKALALKRAIALANQINRETRKKKAN